MSKTILATGATDGIGWATARQLVELGHRVLLHGRSEPKLAATKANLLESFPEADLQTYAADLSILSEVVAFADALVREQQSLDVLINNAGVFKVPETVTVDGLDVRFAVNTIAPYLLALRLKPLLGAGGRVINLSSAAQAPVAPRDLARPSHQPDN
ncbi:MAG: SDR family NAD(P)-dependent oxidoreductase, partial [Pseudomonadota bacterium]|nr:SDR family NAD(P)-dependent oxidoreductase [Pseudomonadota bacterium]